MKTRQAVVQRRSSRQRSAKLEDDILFPESSQNNRRKNEKNNKSHRRHLTQHPNFVVKWDAYRKNLHQHLRNLIRNEHFSSSLSSSRSNESIVLMGQLQYYGDKIRSCKSSILKLFKKLEAENGEDQRHDSLDVSDDNGMVNLEAINCSRCGKEDTDGDDILFCDREGCLRAYHQSCLDPPIESDLKTLDDPDENWFCWQCECLDDCLELVNDFCNTDVKSSMEIFPELERSDHEMMAFSLGSAEDSDIDDEDYNSQCNSDICGGSSSFDDNNDTDGNSALDETDDDMMIGFDDNKILSIDNDEVRYLMAEAGNEAVTTTAVHQRMLRRRKVASNILMDQLMPESVQENQPLARVKKGFVNVGHVKEKVDSTDATVHQWLVNFDDESMLMDWDELRKCLLEYAQYEIDMHKMEQAAQTSKSSLLEPYDECDPKNIVIGKRKTSKVDYAVLNEVMFGNQSSESLAFLDDADDVEFKAKKRRRLSNTSVSRPPTKKVKTRRSRKCTTEPSGIFPSEVLTVASGRKVTPKAKVSRVSRRAKHKINGVSRARKSVIKKSL